MAKTLLNCVNEVFKRLSFIDSNEGVLTSLTDSARQNWIDTTVQVWNETIDALYIEADLPKPNSIAENTITLVTDTRSYSLQSDLNELLWPLLDETNGQYIQEYESGYMQLIESQPYPANYTGLPTAGVISPVDGTIYLDRIPTSNENGLVYKYRYLKELSLSIYTDTVPFKDVVFRQLVVAVAEMMSRYEKNNFNADIYRKSIGMAARYLRQTPQRDSYMPINYKINSTDPYA